MTSAFTLEQLEEYEKHIALPSRFRSSQSPSLTAEYLNALHVHQITAVPYENLLLHYSSHHSVSLE